MLEKSIKRFQSFCSSLLNLSEAKMQDSSDIFVLSGTIHMFNLTFDLAWKVMKDIIVQYHGITDFAVSSPRETLRMARAVGLIEDDIWMEMLRVRNNLTHDYDGELAQKKFVDIVSKYYGMMQAFKEKASFYYKDGTQQAEHLQV